LQSTFWQRPLALDALQKSSPGHQPVRGQQGNLVLSILQQMDGNTSTELITHYAMEHFPDYFLSIAEARQFVQNLVKRYG
jgi:hypothetical protein